MRVFIGRFWGFRPERVPFITFSRAIHRNSLLRASEAGDRIVIVGTKREDPAAEDHGHLLGMAEIGRTAVDTLEVVKPSDIPAREWAGAEPRCPKALPMLQAWRFIGTPPVPPALGWKLPRAAAGAAEGLRTASANLVLALPHESMVIRDWFGPAARADEAKVASGARTAGDPGVLFVYRFGRRNAWKFGNSYDSRRSIEELNRHIPGILTEEKWEIARSHELSSLEEAQYLEQQLGKVLADYNVSGDLFVCDMRTIDAALARAITPGRGKTR